VEVHTLGKGPIQDSLSRQTQKVSFGDPLVSVKIREAKPSTVARRRKRILQKSPKVNEEQVFSRVPPNPLLLATRKRPRLVNKAFYLSWPSLVEGRVTTKTWCLGYAKIQRF